MPVSINQGRDNPALADKIQALQRQGNNEAQAVIIALYVQAHMKLDALPFTPARARILTKIKQLSIAYRAGALSLGVSNAHLDDEVRAARALKAGT
jgi:hypothetical protein